jgi:threonine/homoserine/homoserine lactone efflux protein
LTCTRRTTGTRRTRLPEQTAIVLFANRLRDVIVRPDRVRRVRRILALALVVIAIWLAWSTAR